MTIENAYQILYTIALLVFCVLIGIMLIRSVIIPGVTEKIVCVNMLSTMVICCIAILSRLMEESYLLDVALIYAMISFVAVLMLSTTHIPPGRKRPRFYVQFQKSGQLRPEDDEGAEKDGRGQTDGSGRKQPEMKAGEGAGSPGADAAALKDKPAGQAFGKGEEA